jgi:trehalose 2-sulfotransferase
MFFARNGIEPLWLVYEEMIAALPETIAAIADRVGVQDVQYQPQATQSLQQQRDAISEDWRARFLASQRDMTWLDRPTLKKLKLRDLGWRRLLRRANRK